MLSSDDVNLLVNMTDDEIAGMAYYVGVLESYKNDATLNSEMQMKYTKDELIDCLSFAIGFSAISSIYRYLDGTASLMTAKTAFQIGRGLIGRTLGWVGLAIVTYDYVDCLRSKKKKK